VESHGQRQVARSTLEVWQDSRSMVFQDRHPGCVHDAIHPCNTIHRRYSSCGTIRRRTSAPYLQGLTDYPPVGSCNNSHQAVEVPSCMDYYTLDLAAEKQLGIPNDWMEPMDLGHWWAEHFGIGSQDCLL
jgi:hypothetical protein